MIPSFQDGLGVIIYNVCWSRRTVGKYEEYSSKNRKASVYQVLKTPLPEINRVADLLFLQEVHKDDVEDVTKTFSDYKWAFAATNERDRVCRNATGIKNHLVKNDEFRSFEYDFRKIDKKVDSLAENVLGVISGDLCLINAHFSMREEPRRFMTENFNHCLPSDKKYRTIVAGDFNAMADLYGPQQMETIVKVTKMTCVSDLAVYQSNGAIATRSFESYPYDPVPESALKTPLSVPGKLDQILVDGFKLKDGTVPVVMDDIGASKICLNRQVFE